jgi:hypothetical protein
MGVMLNPYGEPVTGAQCLPADQRTMIAWVEVRNKTHNPTL